MKRQLVIIGAGGHGKVTADLAKKLGYERILFLDDALIQGVEGKVSEFVRYVGCSDFFVAIGNNMVRKRIAEELKSKGAVLVSLIHPNAVVSDNVRIGKGTVVMAGAVVNTDTVLGDGVIVNTCASVDHDCCVGDYVHVAVGAHVCGAVTVREYTWIGAGATLINNISICEKCVIGAGAVIVHSINAEGTYIGVPGRKLNKPIYDWNMETQL